MDRLLLEKSLYRHFKGDMYATMFVSKPVEMDYVWEKSVDGFYPQATHTETGISIIFFKDVDSGDIFHASHMSCENLVVYVSLETGKKYARPIEMFLSEVDKEKYPCVEQQYRFELITENSSNYTRVIEDNNKSNRSNVIITNNCGALMFGDGKIAMTQANYKNDDVKLPALIFSELDEPREVGESYKSDKDNLTKDLFFIFKSKESVETLQWTLEGCKKIFDEEDKEVEQ